MLFYMELGRNDGRTMVLLFYYYYYYSLCALVVVVYCVMINGRRWRRTFQKNPKSRNPESRNRKKIDYNEMFTLNVEDAVLSDLHERLSRTKWPIQETNDWSKGTNTKFWKRLVKYWSTKCS